MERRETKRIDAKVRDLLTGASNAYHQFGRTTHVKQYGSTPGVLVMSDSAVQSGSVYIPAEDFRVLSQLFDALADEFNLGQESLKEEAAEREEASRKTAPPESMV
jgi:hypothetical protein